MNNTINYWPDDVQDGLTQIGLTLMTDKELGDCAPYIPTGIVGLDIILNGGLLRGSLTVLAGRPISGIKTIPHEIAHHVASQTNQTVFLFDTNKDASVSALNILSKLAGYPMPYRWMEKKDPDKLESAKELLDTLPIFVASKAGMNVGWIKSKLEQGCKDAWLPPGLFIVDSIQEMDEAENPENGFDSVMRQLKEIACFYDVAVLVTTDLKQNLDRRRDTRPNHPACPHPSIHKLADLVLYAYDEATYDPESKTRYLELIVGKNRFMPSINMIDNVKFPI